MLKLLLKSIICTAVFSALSLSSAFSAEILIAKFYKKTNHDQSNLYMTTDKNGDIVRFKFDILDSNQKIERSVNVSHAELNKGKLVLEKRGIDVIWLEGPEIERHNGGYIKIRFLKKWRLIGKNKYDNFEVLLDRNGDKWELFKDGRQFTELYADDHTYGINGFSIKK